MSKSKLFAFLLIFLSFSAIFSFYNFDSAYAQGVVWTYNAGTNTATASGSGNTNFAELVQADIDGGWGKFTSDVTGTQIICSAKIVIGDGTNAITFADTKKQIILSVNSAPQIRIRNNATFRLGTLTDLTTRTSTSGCHIISNYTGYVKSFLLDSGSSTEFYSSHFQTTTDRTIISGNFANTNLVRVWNCVFDGYFLSAITSGLSLHKCVFRNTFTGIESCNGEFQYIDLTDTYQAITKTGVYNGTFSNLYVRHQEQYLISMGQNSEGDVYLIDVDSDNWQIRWAGAFDFGTIYRQYTFNLNVLNGEITYFVQNANVTLYKDNVKVYSGLTNSSGMIPTQTLTYGYYQQATGNNIQNATSPYYLVITHPDWQTYVSRFYITEPLRLTVSMQEPTYTGYTEAEKSDYTTIILFVISLILCIIGLALTVPLLPLISLTISVINIIFLSEPTILNILLIILNVTFTLIALVRAKTKNN